MAPRSILSRVNNIVNEQLSKRPRFGRAGAEPQGHDAVGQSQHRGRQFLARVVNVKRASQQ